MPKKQKPRYEWEGVVKAPQNIQFQEVFEAIKEEVGKPVKGNLAKDLEKAITLYLVHKDPEIQKMPRLSEQKACLEEIQKLAKELSRKIEKMDRFSRTKLHRALKDSDFDRPLMDVYRIYFGAEKALQALPVDKGSSDGNTALIDFVSTMREIYEKLTGKKAGMPHYFLCFKNY